MMHNIIMKKGWKVKYRRLVVVWYEGVKTRMCGLRKLEILLVTSNFAGVFCAGSQCRHSHFTRTKWQQQQHNCVLFVVALCGEIWLINDRVAQCLFCFVSTSKSSKHCIYLWGCLFILVVILVVVFILWGCGGGEMVKQQTAKQSAIKQKFAFNIQYTLRHTQIAGTRAEPQQIVAQRLLSCLQYPVP